MDNTTKILIADENQTSRQTIADGLRRAGFGAIYEASNGEEALEETEARIAPTSSAQITSTKALNRVLLKNLRIFIQHG